MYLSKHNISKLTLQHQSVTVTEPEHVLQALKAARIGSGLRSTQQTGVQSCNRTKVEPQPACINLRFQPELYSRVLTTQSIKFAEAKHAQGPSMHRAGTKHVDNRMYTLEQPREATMQPGV